MGTVVDAGLTVIDAMFAVVTDNKDVLVFPPKAAVITEVPLATPVANPVDWPTVPTPLTPEDQTVDRLTSRVEPSL